MPLSLGRLCLFIWHLSALLLLHLPRRAVRRASSPLKGGREGERESRCRDCNSCSGIWCLVRSTLLLLWLLWSQMRGFAESFVRKRRAQHQIGCGEFAVDRFWESYSGTSGSRSQFCTTTQVFPPGYDTAAGGSNSGQRQGIIIIVITNLSSTFNQPFKSRR